MVAHDEVKQLATIFDTVNKFVILTEFDVIRFETVRLLNERVATFS